MLNGFINTKHLPIYALYFGFQSLFVFFVCLLIGHFNIKDKRGLLGWKGFLIMTFFPVPFLVYFYFFVYSAFASLVVLAVFWISICFSIGLSYQIFKSLYPYIVKIQNIIGVRVYYVLIIIIFMSLLVLCGEWPDWLIENP